jgi:hypothetical protein
MFIEYVDNETLGLFPRCIEATPVILRTNSGIILDACPITTPVKCDGDPATRAYSLLFRDYLGTVE